MQPPVVSGPGVEVGEDGRVVPGQLHALDLPSDLDVVSDGNDKVETLRVLGRVKDKVDDVMGDLNLLCLKGWVSQDERKSSQII